jgi:hypothetical protein
VWAASPRRARPRKHAPARVDSKHATLLLINRARSDGSLARASALILKYTSLSVIGSCSAIIHAPTVGCRLGASPASAGGRHRGDCLSRPLPANPAHCAREDRRQLDLQSRHRVRSRLISRWTAARSIKIRTALVWSPLQRPSRPAIHGRIVQGARFGPDST